MLDIPAVDLFVIILVYFQLDFINLRANCNGVTPFLRISISIPLEKSRISPNAIIRARATKIMPYNAELPSFLPSKMSMPSFLPSKMPIAEFYAEFFDKSTTPGTVTWYNKSRNGKHTNKQQTTHTHTYTKREEATA